MSFFGRAARLTGAAVGGTSVVLFSQMWYVRMSFKLPPDASGPLQGVAHYEKPKGNTWWEWLWSSSKVNGGRRNIVFFGDSIVTGVGCSIEASQEHGPILPRRVAQVIAQQIGEDVGWKVLGETGADVRMMTSNLLPLLEDEVRRVGTAGQRIDAVVLLTGLNDIKECFLFAQPRTHNHWSFGRALAELLGSICDTTGGPCSVLVAGTPVDAVPRFNQFWPLSAVMSGVANLWEGQKRLAAEAAQAARIRLQPSALQQEASSPVARTGRPQQSSSIDATVRFLEPPPSMVQQLLDGAKYFAADGMHPNDEGYVVWAELIAQRLLKEFELHVR